MSIGGCIDSTVSSEGCNTNTVYTSDKLTDIVCTAVNFLWVFFISENAFFVKLHFLMQYGAMTAVILAQYTEYTGGCFTKCELMAVL